MILLWPIQIPYQDLAIYLAPVLTGALIGLVVLLIFVPLLFFLLKRRKKILSEQLTPDIDTRPTVPISDIDTKESLPTLGVGDPVTLPVSGQRPTGINWQIAGLTDVGLKRELNEDNLLMIEADTPNGQFALYAVADGMGGHASGEVASQLTLDTLQTVFSQQPPTDPLEEWIKAAIVGANEAVLAHQGTDKKDRKMGSTLVMALFTEQGIHIANVGDSRAYHLTAETIQQISEDHSLVERLIQIGQITREEARVHRQRNVIYNTIGDKSNLQVSQYDAALLPSERLLLCSDGLNNMIPDEKLLEISRSHASPVDACKAMVQAAKTAGGTDNITAIVIEMNPATET